jgi:hypothetical protein
LEKRPLKKGRQKRPLKKANVEKNVDDKKCLSAFGDRNYVRSRKDPEKKYSFVKSIFYLVVGEEVGGGQRVAHDLSFRVDEIHVLQDGAADLRNGFCEYGLVFYGFYEPY